MVYDFIEEHSGYLRLSNQEFKQAKVNGPSIEQSARVVFKYGSESD